MQVDAKKRALVVDDNEVNAMLLSYYVDRVGFTSTRVLNGQEALATLSQAGTSEEDRFDVVFMDVDMPVMDGYEATELIQKLPGDAARIPVIGITGLDEERDLKRCLSVGMIDVIRKPIKTETLRKALELAGLESLEPN